MLLACLGVSEGFMIAIYAIYTLLITTFFFGDAYQTTAGFAGAMNAIPAMMAVSFLPLLQSPDSNLTAGDLWTNSGLSNDLAVFRNFLIVFCWAVFAIVVGIIWPPFRTARQMLSANVLPSVISGLAGYIQQDNVQENDEELRSKMIHVAVAIQGKAKMTMFEPRVWRDENLVKPLSKVRFVLVRNV